MALLFPTDYEYVLGHCPPAMLLCWSKLGKLTTTLLLLLVSYYVLGTMLSNLVYLYNNHLSWVFLFI